MGFSTDSWDLGFQDESILSLERGGLSTQLHDRPVGREARVACPSSRKEQIFPTHFFSPCPSPPCRTTSDFLAIFQHVVRKSCYDLVFQPVFLTCCFILMNQPIVSTCCFNRLFQPVVKPVVLNLLFEPAF
jgi:hypothetical protein